MNLSHFTIRSSWLDKLYTLTLPALFCGTALFVILTFTFGIDHPAKWISGLLFVILIVSRIQSPLKLEVKVPDMLLLLIFLWIFFRSVGAETHLTTMIFFKFCLLPYFFARLIKKENVRFFLTGVVIFAALITILTVINLITLDASAHFSIRPVLFSFPRQQGLISIILGALSVVLSLYSNFVPKIYKSHKYYLFILFQTVLISLILFLQARGPFVVTMLVSFFLILMAKNVPISKRLLTFVFIGLTSYLTIKFLPHNRDHLYKELVSTNSYELLYTNGVREASNGVRELSKGKAEIVKCEMLGNAITIRTFLYREALSIWKNSPFLGSGVYGFAKNSSCIIPYGVPHNLPLHIGSELGLIGLLLFLGFAFFPFTSLLKKMKDSMELKLLILLIAYYLLNFQIAGCSYLECIELYILFGIGANFIDKSVWKINFLPSPVDRL